MRQLDRVLTFLRFVAKTKPLPVLLDEAPRQIAACLEADVGSLYLREDDGSTLVMRGNVGLDRRAQGRVRLKVGEGITGRAVELKRPIAATSAEEHEYFHGIPGLGEERFPVFLAVPILGNDDSLGAIVLQRAGTPFGEAEIGLAAALTAPIASGIRHARVLDDLRKPKRATRGARKVTLTGEPITPGSALGAIAALRRPAEAATEEPHDGDRERFLEAVETVGTVLTELVADAEAMGSHEEVRFLQSYQVMLEDQRLQRLTADALERGESLAKALRHVVGEATKAAADSGDDFLVERARGLEQLCDALRMMASPDPGAALPSRALVVADELGIYDLLVTARANPAGFVLSAAARGESLERSAMLLELLGVPALIAVDGIHRWASPGDIALLDAHHGLLVVNPSRADIATYRAARRRSSRPSLVP